MSETNRAIVNDRYEIGKRIGRGGMAEIFAANLNHLNIVGGYDWGKVNNT